MSNLVGKTLGEYQLTEIIDQSGETFVFKGFQPSKNRYVAIKVLKPDVAQNSAIAQRFLQQAQLAEKMSHPNLLPVYSSGQEQGAYYRTSAFLEHGSLDNNLSRFYNPREALGLFNQIIKALDYIHRQGYVHGNLKPANIFLDAGNSPLLADFGLAQPLGAESSPYLSPEQLQGGVVDSRTDIYALGVVLFEVLTGAPPPLGMIVSLHSKRPGLPEAVEKVIFKAMAQNPDARYQSVDEFRNAFDYALRPPARRQPAPVQTPRQTYATPASVPLPPPAKKDTNWAAIILSIMLIAVLCVGAWFLVGIIKNGDNTPVAPTDVPTAPTAPPEPTSPPVIPTEPDVPIEPTKTPLPPLPPICNSINIAGGAIILGGVTRMNRRRKKRNR